MELFQFRVGGLAFALKANAGLQQDTIDLLRSHVLDLHPECEQSDVVFVAVVGGDDEATVEHWYTSTCGLVEVWKVLHALSSDGGTDITVAYLPVDFELVNRAVLEIPTSGLITEAQRLRIQYVGAAGAPDQDGEWIGCNATVFELELSDAEYLLFDQALQSGAGADFEEVILAVLDRCGEAPG